MATAAASDEEGKDQPSSPDSITTVKSQPRSPIFQTEMTNIHSRTDCAALKSYSTAAETEVAEPPPPSDNFDADGVVVDFNANTPLFKPGQNIDESYRRLTTLETKFMAKEEYYRSALAPARAKAVNYVDEMTKRATALEETDAFLPYLAINYFDRFVSRARIPKVSASKELKDDIELIAFCCLTLACKMRARDFNLIFFLTAKGREAHLERVQGVETMIKKRLKQRMRSLTPLCFIDCFVPHFQSSSGYQYTISRRSIYEILIQCQGDINLTRFRPSMMAACAMLDACSNVYDDTYGPMKHKIMSRFPMMRSEVIEDCVKEINFLRRLKKVKVEDGSEGESSRIPPFGQVRDGPEVSFDLHWFDPRAAAEALPDSSQLRPTRLMNLSSWINRSLPRRH